MEIKILTVALGIIAVFNHLRACMWRRMYEDSTGTQLLLDKQEWRRRYRLLEHKTGQTLSDQEWGNG